MMQWVVNKSVGRIQWGMLHGIWQQGRVYLLGPGDGSSGSGSCFTCLSVNFPFWVKLVTLPILGTHFPLGHNDYTAG